MSSTPVGPILSCEYFLQMYSLMSKKLTVEVVCSGENDLSLCNKRTVIFADYISITRSVGSTTTCVTQNFRENLKYREIYSSREILPTSRGVCSQFSFVVILIQELIVCIYIT